MALTLVPYYFLQTLFNALYKLKFLKQERIL